MKREKRVARRLSASPRRPTPTWVLASAATAVFVALSAVYLVAGELFSPIPAFLVSEVAFIAPIIGSTVGGWYVHRRSSGAESRFWLLLASANAIMMASELYYIYWVVFVDLNGPPPVYAPFQVMHAFAALLIFGTLMAMTKFQNGTFTMRVRWGLDMVSGAVILYMLMYEYVVKPLFANIPTAPVERVFGAAYPTWGVAMLVGTLATLLGFKVSRWRPWERLVALSLCIYAAGIAAWPLWLVTVRTEGASLERGVLDIVLLLGHFLLFVAVLWRLHGSGERWPLRPMPLFQPVRNRLVGVATPMISLLALPVSTYMALRAGPGTSDFLVYLGATSLLALVTVVRSTVVASENGRLFHRAATDAITGLFNLPFMHERLAVEIEVARRYGEQISIVVLDIDDFERVNDLYGHPVGDEVLREFGAVLKASCRDSDIVCRVGGDEFAAILPDAGSLEALKVCLRAQLQFARLKVRGGGRITASVGIATCPEHATTAEDLIRLAQGARYWVKRHGKDRVLVYDPSVVAELDDDDRIRTLEQQSHIGAVRALAAAVDARDAATQDHSRNVAVLAVRVARDLGLDERRVRLLESAALMHDVGKIGVPDDILRKPGPLDAEERLRVSEHAALGERILSSTSQREMLPWVRHHHESWDGTGYPDHLRAVEIPLEARILAVCDAYDAMTSDRPYRPAMSSDEALVEIERCMGTQFDPSVVDVFLRSLGREVTGL